MSLNVRDFFTYDDVLLVPKYSTVKSRKDIDLSVDLGSNIKLDIPICSANMKNVTGPHLALEIAKLGGLAILNRFYDNPVIDQIQAFKNCTNGNNKYTNHIGVSIGVQQYDLDSVSTFISNGIKIICLDIAHADCEQAVKTIKSIKKEFKDRVFLIAGNIATFSGFAHLAEAGADLIKFGIGGGSLCTTRIETGNGVPQLSGLAETYEYAHNYWPKIKLISDGGIKNSGDIVKSLCFSHVVMLGNLLAGTDESPGETIIVNGKNYKTYAGSSTFKKEHVEGVSALVPEKGPVKNVIEKLLQGLRSGCSYQNAHNLEELKKDPQFVSITQAGLIESKPHDVY